jgi:asparagine synthase (glutamine-hydrolysing)
MCGITGFIDYNKNSREEVLHKMTDILNHRGPDGSGYRIIEKEEATIGLGHRRLSIIDLSDSASQPMTFEHTLVTFNGEIYNYKSIKEELVRLGHSFKTHSDTEVLLHAYTQWGTACNDKFTGMFAFVIYDSKKEELFCVRDRAGVKPFFYYWNNGLFLFASELKVFHQHPDFKKELDLNAVAAFIQYGNVPSPHCIFKNCHKLKAGHYLSFSIKEKKLSVHKYWDVYDSYNKPKLDISFEEAKKETEKVLKSSFDYRMVSDVPVGIFLSGGYDSACLTALLQKDRTEKLKTFTIGVEDISLNEAPFAKNIASRLGTDHHEYYCSQKDALELIPNIPYYYDEPFADQSALPTTLVCKMAHNHVTVALGADGGDEVFAGYNRYDYLMKYGGMLNSLPGFVRKSASAMMSTVSADKIPVLNKKHNFHNRYEKLKSLLDDPSPKNMMLSLSKQYNDDQLKELFFQKVQNLNTSYLSDDLKQEFYSPLAYMMAIDYQTYLQDDILQKLDRASMTVSLEAREPFLDHTIIEWAARLPDDYKYHHGIKKYILKEIVHQYLPKDIMNRPKMGFAIPIENWLLKDLKDRVMDYLKDEKIAAQGIFDVAAVRKLRNDFFAGKKELALKIWYLLMFQMWYEKWMK